MDWIVEPAKAGAHGFDTAAPISKAKAIAFRRAGFHFAVRYLTRHASPPAHDLTPAELTAITGAGLALMAVQHVAMPGWRANAKLGGQNGVNAARHAAWAGLPKGMTLYLDLEEVSRKTSPADVIAYCNAWYDAVHKAGYLPGIYVGSGSGLTADQLYYNLKFKTYWKSGSRVPPIPLRGYAMVQKIIPGDKIAGIAIDRNVIMADQLGALPTWARTARSQASSSTSQ